jgi:hypothetical protein
MFNDYFSLCCLQRPSVTIICFTYIVNKFDFIVLVRQTSWIELIGSKKYSAYRIYMYPRENCLFYFFFYIYSYDKNIGPPSAKWLSSNNATRFVCE